MRTPENVTLLSKDMLNQEFDTAVSDADFLCAHWRPEHCDPTKWEEPSTHGIEGVELVGDPHMKMWNETTSWKNPGRFHFKTSNVQHLAERIQTEGIIPSRVVYYDVETDETNNGAHRRGGSEILDIPGWMHQGVRFANELAKIRFANASNHVEGLFNNEPTKDDVKAGVRAALKQMGSYSKKTIREEVSIQGPGLTEKQQHNVVNDLYSEFMFDSKMESDVRYRDLNNDNVVALMKTIAENHSGQELWVEDYWFNEDEHTLCVNVGNWESRIGAILNAAALASKADRPLHFIFVVPIPSGNETLGDLRERFFTVNLKNLENRLLDIQGKSHTDKNRREFPWNNSECQHRTVAQDTENEETIPLIKVKNRKFN